MPEGNSQASEQQAAASGGPARPLYERYGFEDEDAMAAAFDELKADLKRLKSQARSAGELERRLAEYEAAEQKRKEAEMTEAQKLAQRIAAMEKQLAERDAMLTAKQREIVTERVFAQKLSGRPSEEAAILRRLMAAAVSGQEFADEAELTEMLKPVEAEYDAFRATLGGGGGGGQAQRSGAAAKPAAPGFGTPPAGDTRKSSTGQAFLDFMRLPIAEQVAVARRANNK